MLLLAPFGRSAAISLFWRDCVPTGSWEKNCYEASVNPEFGSTLARRLNQSCFPAVLQSNQITTKFGMAEARRLNWALLSRFFYRLRTTITKCNERRGSDVFFNGIAPL